MGRKNVGVEQAMRLHAALDTIGVIVGRPGLTPRGRLQQIVGVLASYGVSASLPVAVAEPSRVADPLLRSLLDKAEVGAL